MTAVLTILFIAGYLAIAFESVIKIDKAAIALITGVLSWVIYSIPSDDAEAVAAHLSEAVSELSGILFFLMGAMAIVELIDAHDGFEIISSRIRYGSRRKLLWIISLITFCLSPVLDNLTTAIVMTSFLRKFIKLPQERMLFCGIIIIAANAGGAWSPVGDVTTTMLWMGGQVTTFTIIGRLFLPSLFCLLIPLLIVSLRMKKQEYGDQENAGEKSGVVLNQDQYLIFISGVLIILAVPVFKILTGLPPYMGMLIGLGILWVITEIIHGKKDEEEKHSLSVAYALQKIDTPSILFFLGILLSISALQAAGILNDAAGAISRVASEDIIVIATGLLSAVVDNVPLVAASQAMYSLGQYPADHHFWIFLAYCTGTGGSLLIIGSAAGVAVMGMEKITFIWYLKNFTFLALLGFIAGIIVYLLQYHFL